jgi:predicted phosphodiesterase
MRFQLFSDLHKDFARPKPIRIVPGVDAVVVPGDVCEGAENAFVYLRSFVPADIPIVFALGNHEFYERFLPAELAVARATAPHHGVALLENDAVEIAGIRFAGATTWTDYRLFGDSRVAAAMAAARHGMDDHRRIGWGKKPWRRFTPQEAAVLHRRTRDFLATATRSDRPTVVVSHHAPSHLSIAEEFEGDLLNAAFASDIAHRLMDNVSGGSAQGPGVRIDVWCHGHTHNSVDYRIGSARVLSNPHGYGDENAEFDPALVVEVSP